MNNTQSLLNKAQERVIRHSKESLSRALRVDRANLNRMFRGEGYPNAVSQIELAKLLELPVEEVAEKIAQDKKESRRKTTTLMGYAVIAAATLATGTLTAISSGVSEITAKYVDLQN